MRFLIFLFTAICIACPALAQKPSRTSPKTRDAVRRQPAKPNVIFILADDLGWGDLGCYGNEKIKTPNLDKLAGRGILFTHFYANAPVCAPSRAAFFTGRYAESSGAYSGEGSNEIEVPAGLPNLATLFKQAGYQTLHTGKWHLSAKTTPDTYGFDQYQTREANSWGERQKDPYFRAKSTGYLVENTIDFIEAHPESPFFVQLWAVLPHSILFPTEDQLAVYDKFDMRKTFKMPGFQFTSAEQIYYASVTALDSHLGQLFDYLEAKGLSQNTLIVFASDNGPAFIESLHAGHSGAGSTGPFRGRKTSIYEGGIRMPLIVSMPGRIPQGKVNDTTVMAAIDFLPTLSAIIGTKTDGEDMSGAWMGAGMSRKEPVFWRWRWEMPPQLYHRSPALAMRQGDWKLMMNPDNSRLELYNLATDPTELDNRSREYPKVAADMQKALLEWHKALPQAKFQASASQNDYNWPKTK